MVNLRMTITNKECDDQGKFDESIWKELKDAVITMFK